MEQYIIPEGYKAPLSTYDQQRAIEFIKSEFQRNLRIQLHLKRVSAPSFVTTASGLNDNLNGYERAVSFLNSIILYIFLRKSSKKIWDLHGAAPLPANSHLHLWFTVIK